MTYTEILFNDAFVNEYHSHSAIRYDGVTLSRATALEQAEEKREIYQRIRDHVDAAVAGEKPLYVKYTQGKRQGTIARVTNPEAFILVTNDGTWNTKHIPEQCDNVTIIETGYKGVGSLSFGGMYMLKLESKYTQGTRILLSNGTKQIADFAISGSTTITGRLTLLLDYEGDVVSVHNKKVTKVCYPLKDRYGRDVNQGDLIICGNSTALYIGKVEFIDQRRTVTIKHIGADETAHIYGVTEKQVLLITDDIKQDLMLEKLKRL